MIDTSLLKNYQDRALGIAVYGPGGMQKTLATCTLPGPTLELDFEGGSGCLGPWTRRIRKWNGEWKEYSQEERERLLSLVTEERRKSSVGLLPRPAPIVDIISFETMQFEVDNSKYISKAYDHCFELITNFPREYNSVSVDPLVEFSQITQTQSKLQSNVSPLAPMHVKLWQGAQERAAIMLRVLREYRERGLFIYMTSSEFVDKDYGTDPRESGQKEEPYAIKGDLNVPGQLVNKVNHMIDIQCHTRLMNGQPVWVTTAEPARSGSFNWEAKDRTGRLQDKFLRPSVRTIIQQVYGKEEADVIYQQRTLTA